MIASQILSPDEASALLEGSLEGAAALVVAVDDGDASHRLAAAGTGCAVRRDRHRGTRASARPISTCC